jgi:hypothetical protein
MALLTRRSLLGGLFAAPAVVKAASLMPVKLWVPEPAVDPFVALIAKYRPYTQFYLHGSWLTATEIVEKWDPLPARSYIEKMPGPALGRNYRVVT